MSVLLRTTRPHIPGDGTLYSHDRENLKSNITPAQFHISAVEG
jgi:hypothetical protein